MKDLVRENTPVGGGGGGGLAWESCEGTQMGRGSLKRRAGGGG